MGKKPLHVFIIPDGNRRWAKAKGLAPWEGHRQGYDVFEKITRKIWTLGVSHLTVWGLSKDNLINRSQLEISILMEIFENTIDELFSSKEAEKEKLRVRVAGRWKEFFGKKLIEKINALEKKTAAYDGDKNLTLLLAYNGDDEIKNALWQFKNNPLGRQVPSAEDLHRWSWTWFLPNVDIMIRTGFEPHLSSRALMLLMTDTHLYFPQMHWPDFSIKELAKIIDDFKNRERRFGA